MARPALRIEVTTKDQKELRKLLSGGVQQVRVVLRAVALLQLAKGVSIFPLRIFHVQNIRNALRCHATTVRGFTITSAERQSVQT